MFTFSELISDFTFWLARSIFFCSVFRFTAWPYGSLPSLRSESEQSYQSTKPLSKAAIGSAAVRGFARRYCSNSRTTPTPGLSAAARLRRFTFHLHVIGLIWRVSFPFFFSPSQKKAAVKTQEKVESVSVTKTTSAKVSVPERARRSRSSSSGHSSSEDDSGSKGASSTSGTDIRAPQRSFVTITMDFEPWWWYLDLTFLDFFYFSPKSFFWF